MTLPPNLPPKLLEQLKAITDAAHLAMPFPRADRMAAYFRMLPLPLVEQILADRHVLDEQPEFTDPRVLRLAMVTIGAYNLMIREDVTNRQVGDPAEMMRGLHGSIGMLGLHIGERLGLLKLVEGPEHPWDWEHRVHYTSEFPDLVERMIALDYWDPTDDRERAFRTPHPPSP